MSKPLHRSCHGQGKTCRRGVVRTPFCPSGTCERPVDKLLAGLGIAVHGSNIGPGPLLALWMTSALVHS